MGTISYMNNPKDAAIAVLGGGSAQLTSLRQTLSKLGVKAVAHFDRADQALLALESRDFDLLYIIGSPVDMDPLTFVRTARSAALFSVTPMAYITNKGDRLTALEKDFLKSYSVSVLDGALTDMPLIQNALITALHERANKTSFQSRLVQAKETLRAGLMQQAKEIFDSILRESEWSIVARVGLLRASVDDPVAYWQQLKKLLEMDPANYFFRFELVDRYVKEGRFGDASQTLEALLGEIRQQSSLFWLVELGVICVNLRLYAFCLKISSLIRLQEEKNEWQADLLLSRTYLAADNVHDAQKFLDLAVQSAPGERPEIENLRAIIARKFGDFDEAISRYQSALRLSPDDHRIPYNIGVCYEHVKDWHSAAKYFRLSLDLSPTYSRAKTKLDELVKRALVE